jgi:predicted MarR family transcription regulator
MRRRLDPEQQEVLRARQARLTALSEHPAWDEMEAEVERKIARIEKTILARSLSTGLSEVEQAQMRGMIAALRWFVTVPKSAERSLARFLKEQGITVPAEITEEE